uniref:Prostamide/prostaglandin F synthase n=1 Tax=Timema poppense TaxID=170557 RepID=A0A7R9CK48_TIMPO|nr:unnamed protein product [Timema poppensis]
MKKCIRVVQKINKNVTSLKMENKGKVDYLKKIANIELKKVSTNEMTKIEDVWKDKNTVIIFFRRWGCLLCRVWAKEINEIAPILKENNVNLVGVGVDETGLEEFKEGKYFAGDLYVDTLKQAYKAMEFKRFNIFSILTALFTKESREAISKGKAEKLGGDLRGDGLQNGGAVIVSAGGSKLLYHFKQERPAEHLSNYAILKALGLENQAPPGMEKTTTKETTTECVDDVLSIPTKEKDKVIS